MSYNIVEEVKEITVNVPDSFDSNQVKDLIEASRKFEELVQKGLVKKRGYNLLSREESLNFNYINFNRIIE